MKTLNKATSYIFSVIALVAFIAALFGATHQLALAGICAMMAWVFYPREKQMKNKPYQCEERSVSNLGVGAGEHKETGRIAQ